MTIILSRHAGSSPIIYATDLTRCVAWFARLNVFFLYRYVVLSLMKIMLVCDRDAVQPCLPDMVRKPEFPLSCVEADIYLRVVVLHGTAASCSKP